jgi:lysophospholipase
LTGAPLFDDVADGPPDGRAVWATASDGVRLRLTDWRPESARGTVLLFPGRTEYIEKYGALAGDLAEAGLATATIDWRGQGMADRLLPDRHSGHVGAFADYQRDVGALLAHVRGRDLPRPFFLLAHSMGGAIGLRALLDGLEVERVAFSSPMWGITLSAGLRPAAWAMSWTAEKLGLTHLYAPGTSGSAYPNATPFEANLLTHDEAQYTRLAMQTEAHPELALGGPSLGWLREALAECEALAGIPSPDIPCVTILGTEERIVDPAEIERRMAAWRDGRLVMIEGGSHECFMETPERRETAVRTVLDHFAP